MKLILFKVKSFPRVSETFVLQQIITAINLGFDVKVLVHEYIDEEAKNYREIIEKYGLDKILIVENYKIPSRKWKRYIKTLFLFLKNIFFLKKIISFIYFENKIKHIKIFQFDFYRELLKNAHVVHVQFGNNHQPLDQLKKIELFDFKLIVSFHGHDSFFPIYNFLTEGFYDVLFEVVDHAVVNTPYLFQQLLKIGCPKSKLTTIPIGIDTSYFVNDKRVDNCDTLFKLVTVGRLQKVKGHILAINVLERLRKTGVDASLTIIGEGEEREQLEKAIVEKNIQKYVVLLGAKGQEEIIKIFNESDVFIFTSIVAENKRRETFGIACIEAQACGLPIVAFDSGGVKYTLVEKSGFLVKEGDINGMVDKLKYLNNNFDLIKQMGIVGAQNVQENFSKEKIGLEWKKLYS